MTVSLPAIGAVPSLLAWLDSREARYEVLDGSVVVTPPARLGHERLGPRIAAALLATVPDDCYVLGPNYAVRYAPGSFLLPDVLVARREDCLDDGMTAAPLLVVEILSPSTRRRDHGEKRDIYAELAVPHYWLVDPDRSCVVVQHLVQGRYETVTTALGRLELDDPFPVRLELG